MSATCAPIGGRVPGWTYAGCRVPLILLLSSARALQAAAADPGGADHVGVGAEHQAARQVGRVVVATPPERGDEDGSTAMTSASLPASSEPMTSVETQRPRAPQRAEPEPFERSRPGRVSTPAAARAFCDVEPDPHRA